MPPRPSRGLRPLRARWHPSRFSIPLSLVGGYSRISPSLILSFGEDLRILTRSPPSITLLYGHIPKLTSDIAPSPSWNPLLKAPFTD